MGGKPSPLSHFQRVSLADVLSRDLFFLISLSSFQEMALPDGSSPPLESGDSLPWAVGSLLTCAVPARQPLFSGVVNQGVGMIMEFVRFGLRRAC